MALDIEAMRAKLAEEEEKSTSSDNKTHDNNVFAHWNIPMDSTAIIRFLPDADESNPYFWRDRVIRKLPFKAVEGVDLGNKKQVFVTVPDLNQFDKNLDPIQTEIGPWWDEGRKEEYRIYKKKFSHIYQGFVRVDPGVEKEDEVPENPIRRFFMAPSLHETIKAIIMNPKIKHLPTDFENGRDFEIIMRQKGEYNNYDASSWSFEEDALSENELEALDKHGLWDLGKFVFDRPSPEHINAIAEMFEASVAGLPYEPDRWGEFYKPAGVNVVSTSTTTNGKPSETDTPEVEGEKTKTLLDKVKKAKDEPKEEPKEESTDTEESVEETPKTETTTKKKKSSTADLLKKLQERRGEKA